MFFLLSSHTNVIVVVLLPLADTCPQRFSESHTTRRMTTGLLSSSDLLVVPFVVIVKSHRRCNIRLTLPICTKLTTEKVELNPK